MTSFSSILATKPSCSKVPTICPVGILSIDTLPGIRPRLSDSNDMPRRRHGNKGATPQPFEVAKPLVSRTSCEPAPKRSEPSGWDADRAPECQRAPHAPALALPVPPRPRTPASAQTSRSPHLHFVAALRQCPDSAVPHHIRVKERHRGYQNRCRKKSAFKPQGGFAFTNRN